MTPPAQSVKCTRCGAPVAAGARFCAACGSDVSGEQGNAATHISRAPDPRATMSATALLEAIRHATGGDYDVQAELGRGGMATVFLAHEIALDRKVAIKVMSPALFTGEGMVERFKREAKTAASLSHPHIIPIFTVKESEHLVFFVMKFVEGRPLDSIIKEVGPLPIPMVRAILQQVGGALGYAHRRGIVHRDIKPANIMIDADGWAVVTDFGIAKVTETQGLTMTGATIGTPSYMSPEQCAAKEVTGSSDQYSLGIVAYEMVTGKLPFTADSIMAIMYAHFNEPPPSIAKARPDCPPEIVEALGRMLAKDPADRFPDVEAAVAALGAMPLAHDDPIRTRMMTLAATGIAAQTLRQVATPVSPSPQGRTKPAAGRPAGRTIPPTTGMTLSPARVTVAVGGAVQLTASRKSQGGMTLPGNEITWASTNNEVASVSDTGLVTAVGPGNVIITATMGTVSATGQVTVTPAQVRKSRTAAIVGGLVAVAAIGAGAYVFGPWSKGAVNGPPVNRPIASDTPVRATVPPVVETQPPPAPPAAPPAAPANPRVTAAMRERQRQDSIISALRADAQTARGRAEGAGATSAELASGESQRSAAENLARAGRYDDAFARMRDAISQWRNAEQTARTRSTQIAVAPPRVEPPPPAPPPAPVPAPPAAPSAAAVRQQIAEAIAGYGKALESRNIAQIRQVYPGLTAQQERGWRDFFQVAQNLRVSLGVTDVQQTIDAAEATVAGTYEYRDNQSRRDQHQSVSFRVSLERGGGGWRIITIR
jgi:uncharacterized protein YjdB